MNLLGIQNKQRLALALVMHLLAEKNDEVNYF